MSEPSPLTELKYFGMVSNVILEPMHTLYELLCKHFLSDVILKKYLNNRLRFPRENRFGELARYSDVLDSRIILAQRLCPDEFQRKVSSTAWLKGWKATEHRQFWLYMAYPLLEDLLRDHVRAHNDKVLEMIRYYFTCAPLFSRCTCSCWDKLTCKFCNDAVSYPQISGTCRRSSTSSELWILAQSPHLTQSLVRSALSTSWAACSRWTLGKQCPTATTSFCMPFASVLRTSVTTGL